MAFTVGEYQDIFLEEADEQLQEMNQNLLHLEKDPDNSDIINNIFRTAHSLKSSAAFVGLNDLSDLAHRMENLLQGIRDRTMSVNTVIIDLLFKCFDAITSVINAVAAGEEPQQDLSGIIGEIQELSNGVIKNERVEKMEPAMEETIARTSLNASEVRSIRGGLEGGDSCTEIIVFMEPDAVMKVMKVQLVVSALGQIGKVVTTVPDMEGVTEESLQNAFKIVLLTKESDEEIRKACDVDQVNRIDLRRITLSRVKDKLALKFHEKQSYRDHEVASDHANTPREIAEKLVDDDITDADEDQYLKTDFERKRDDRKSMVLKTVKVSIDKLDSLLNNVGELVIANSGFYRLYDELRKEIYEKNIVNEFKSRMEQMSRIAKDLQTAIMKTRMVPIGQVFNRFNRLVRDLAHEFKKNVQLVIRGEDTELDKKVIDVIGEPLMHLIRNAIDHGIEPEEERIRVRKSETATVTLNAYQGGNQIFVEVGDDGRGLDIEKIKQKVIEKGMATREMMKTMDAEDIYQFIFNPGFTTATVITDVSGRGVGMNVVREIVNELNGNIAIETEQGMGTRFIMSFPLTLAIIPAIMVRVAKELYAIPLSDVIETVKIDESDITTIEGHEVINLRGEILSLLRLSDFIDVDSALEEGRKVPVVVVGFGNRKVGLMVDTLEGKQEIVIKSLEQNYTTVEGLAGASILGDGSICLILDVSSMINKVIGEQELLSRREKHRMVEAARMKKAEHAVEEAEVSPPRDAVMPPEASDERAGIASFPESGEMKEEPEVKEDIIYEKEISAGREGAEEAPVEEAFDEEEKDVEKSVKETLNSFKEELKESISSSVEVLDTDEYIRQTLQMSSEDLNRMQVLANSGIARAAESLSKIVKKRIDLSIPEVRILPLEKIPESIGEIDSVYMGVYMPLEGSIRGTILFSLLEDSGFDLVNLLYGAEAKGVKELSEDGESALIEVTNIVGSSVVNEFSEQTELVIKPTVPTLVHDYMQSILDSILVLHNISNDFALIMNTEFYYQDETIIGNLLILPETDSLKVIVNRLRE